MSSISGSIGGQDEAGRYYWERHGQVGKQIGKQEVVLVINGIVLSTYIGIIITQETNRCFLRTFDVLSKKVWF